jgi:hypothetical protein
MHPTRAKVSRPLVIAAALTTTLGIATGVVSLNGADTGSGQRATVANAAAEARPSTTAKKKAAASTKSDCPFSVERPFVQNGRLYARTTITCKKRHDISVIVTLRRPTWIGDTYIAEGRMRLNNWKGTKSLTTSISCNEVSPRTNYTTGATLYDKRFLGYPIEVDGRKSSSAKGC